jgi:hypothetical protein
MVVELASGESFPGASPMAAAPAPIRFHLYGFGSGQWLTAGIERLDG